MDYSISNDGRPWRTFFILGLLFLAAWLPRAIALDEFVTPDERKWLARSANFNLALHEQEWRATYQTEHPGVTTMWLGTLGWRTAYPDYVKRAPGQMADIQLEEWLAADDLHSPLALLVSLRRWITLAIAACVVATFFPLRRLFGEVIAGLAVLYMAWDPFYVALSRQLHLDGLLAALLCLALLTFLAWLYGGRQRGSLAASGVVVGLALLTKTPAVFILPTTALLLLIEMSRRHDDRRVLVDLVMAYALWLALAGATFFILWPVLWRNAPDVLRTIVEMMTIHGQGHELPNFFRGEITYDPGPLFYPVAFFFRTTPFTLVGMALALLWAWQRRWPLAIPAGRWSLLGLWLFVFVFTAGMTLGAKKFDRYLLPIFPVLDIVAVLGLAGAVSLFSQWWRDRQSATSADAASHFNALGLGVLVALFFVHGWLGLRHAPYYLTYYNPLAVALSGGTQGIDDVMLVGWGDGLDEAARWLGQQPESEKLRLASWYQNGPFSYFIDTDKRILPYSDGDFWLADYAVAYVNQWQREIPSREVSRYYATLDPVHTVTLNGLTMAHIYDQRAMEPPAFTGISTAPAAMLGDGFHLLATQVPNRSALPGDDVALTLFLERVAPVADDYEMHLRLVAADGTELWREVRPPAGVRTTDWPLNEIWQDPYEIEIPPTAEPGPYTLRLTMRNAATGAALPIQSDAEPDAADAVEAWKIGELIVQQPAEVPVDASWPDVTITSLRHAPQLTPGQPFIVEMEAAGAVNGTYKLSTRLQNGDGIVLAQQDTDLLEEMRFALTVPAGAPAGDYALAVVVYDPVSLNPIADVNGEFSTPLSTIAVPAAD